MRSAGRVGHSVPHERTWDRMSHKPGFLTVDLRAFPSTYIPAFTAVTCASMTTKRAEWADSGRTAPDTLLQAA